MLDELPVELQEVFIEYLSIPDRLHLKETCRTMDKVVTRYMWKYVDVMIWNCEDDVIPINMKPKPGSCRIHRVFYDQDTPRPVTKDYLIRTAERQDRPPENQLVRYCMCQKVNIENYFLAKTRRRAFEFVQNLRIDILISEHIEELVTDIARHFKLSPLKHLTLTFGDFKAVKYLYKFSGLQFETLGLRFPKEMFGDLLQVERALTKSKLYEKLTLLEVDNLSFTMARVVSNKAGLVDSVEQLQNILDKAVNLSSLFIKQVEFSQLSYNSDCVETLLEKAQHRLTQLQLQVPHCDPFIMNSLQGMLFEKDFSELTYLYVCDNVFYILLAMGLKGGLKMPNVEIINIEGQEMYDRLADELDEDTHQCDTRNELEQWMDVLPKLFPRLDSILIVSPEQNQPKVLLKYSDTKPDGFDIEPVFKVAC